MTFIKVCHTCRAIDTEDATGITRVRFACSTCKSPYVAVSRIIHVIGASESGVTVAVQ